MLAGAECHDLPSALTPGPQVLDPHVAVLLSDGSALLLRGDPAGRRLGLARSALPVLQDAIHAEPDEQVHMGSCGARAHGRWGGAMWDVKQQLACCDRGQPCERVPNTSTLYSSPFLTLPRRS